MQRNSEFLGFTPSQQAAAALILSLNVCYSPVCDSIGLTRLGDKFTSIYEEEVSVDTADPEETEDPLSVWSTIMTELTHLSVATDLKPLYE